MTTTRCRHCGDFMGDEQGNECSACTELVLTFQPRRSEPPQFIAWFEDDLGEGDLIGGDQCDGCGSPAYEITKTPHGWAARSVADPDDDCLPEGFEACGKLWPLSWKQVWETVMP